MGDAVREIKLPVRAGGDGVLVEEGREFAARAEFPMLCLDFFNETGDPARGVVAPGVGDEEVADVRLGGHTLMECDLAVLRVEPVLADLSAWLLTLGVYRFGWHGSFFRDVIHGAFFSNDREACEADLLGDLLDVVAVFLLLRLFQFGIRNEQIVTVNRVLTLA